MISDSRQICVLSGEQLYLNSRDFNTCNTSRKNQWGW